MAATSSSSSAGTTLFETMPTPTLNRILGPLTTTFTPASACSNLYELSTDALAGTPVLTRGALCPPNIINDESCLPPATLSNNDLPSNGAAYSPGLWCPSGYSTACQAAMSDNGQPAPMTSAVSFAFPQSLLPGESAAGCCPRYVLLKVFSICSLLKYYSAFHSGYNCLLNGHGIPQCVSVTLDGSVTATQCLPPDAVITIHAPLEVTTTSPSSFYGTTIDFTLTSSFQYISVFASMIPIYWKASDRPPPTAASTTGPQSTIQHATSTPQPSGSLSTGAKAAVGVVVPVLILLAAALLASLLFRRRKRRLGKKEPSTEYDKPELDSTSIMVSTADFDQSTGLDEADKVEMGAAERVRELGIGLPHELAAPTVVHELEGSGHESVEYGGNRSERPE